MAREKNMEVDSQQCWISTIQPMQIFIVISIRFMEV